MSYNPGVSFFIPFHQLDPRDTRCIFFTQKVTRCLWSCRASDKTRAIALHRTITANEATSFELIREYVLCSCCRSDGARHRDRIEDIGLLIPVAQRWQDEILRQAAEYNPLRSSNTSVFAQDVGSLSRYDLRPRSLNIIANATSARSVSQTPLSEFRPHVADPRPNDNVAWQICEPLLDRDFETGSLYIFDRASSPGHVKIGWTAKSVPQRLEDWSKCGYEPKLLFEVHSVPHAQRAETLTHYQLIREWRRERMCKGCGKSH
jgi:hypothetical protein